MRLVQTVKAMHELANHERRAGKSLALVPTMGALHRGHLALVEEAKKRADHVTVSIFVNPTQFGPNEDYSQYPRQLDADQSLLRELGGVDLLFAPTVQEFYPFGVANYLSWITVDRLDEHLCGRFRPGHFRGVTTVVSKLFNSCKPHLGVFGLKDAQQYLILQRMVSELSMDVSVVGSPTIREADGLALSSRNRYLSIEERRQSVVVSRAVSRARQMVEEGEQRVEAIVEAMLDILGEAPSAQVQYAEVVETETIQPIKTIQPGQEVLAAVAVFFGKTRLIDSSFSVSPI